MDALNEQKGRVQAILDELLITPNTKEALEDVHRSIIRALATYLNQAMRQQNTATSEENAAIDQDIEELKARCSEAEQEIKKRLEQLDQPPLPIEENVDQKGASTSTDDMDKIIGDMKQLPNPDAAALTALLTQIANQYKEILAGKYPRPEEKEPLLGAVQHPVKEIKVTHSTNPKKPQITNVTMESKEETFQCHADRKDDKVELPRKLNPNTIQQPIVELKMDRFKLPTFNGDLTQWLTFRDQFIDLVHTNPHGHHKIYCPPE